MVAKYIFVFVFLPCAGISCAAAQGLPFPKTRPSCVATAELTAADMSIPAVAPLNDKHESALLKLKDLGVTTLLRYYDQENETLPGKTLHAEESDAIISAGLKIGVVFQHHNDDPGKFLKPLVGKEDAERALNLADENRQPYGSAIYFGVDGPEFHLAPLMFEYRSNDGKAMSDARKSQLQSEGKSYFIESYDNFRNRGPKAFHLDQLDRVKPDMMQPIIGEYFQEIKATFAAYATRHHGDTYRIGMYCTAGMCKFGVGHQLADYFWMSPEKRKQQAYGEFLNSSRLNLVQQLTTSCPPWGPLPDGIPLRFEFDFDLVNPAQPNFGEWSKKRS
ncbi:MAG TPA: glycoside hydrolase domain-containing protein [Methylovirgula sp.]